MCLLSFFFLPIIITKVYSSNKILWCLRNDGYDFPYGPPKYWTGLCTDNEKLVVDKFLLVDFDFVELQVVEEHNEDEEYNEDFEDVDKCTYKDNLSYIIEGTLTDDSGKSFHIEGISIPIDNGRRISFRYVDNTKTIGINNECLVWNYYGYLTAFGIIGKCWPDGTIVENASFFWLWEDI